MEVANRYIVIKHNIDGAPQESDFELKSEAFSLSIEPGKRDVIVKNLYLSIDPYQFNRMKNQTPSQQAMNFAGTVIPGKVSCSFSSTDQCHFDMEMNAFSYANSYSHRNSLLWIAHQWLWCGEGCCIWPEYEKDDLVSGLLSWGEYSIIKEGGGMLRKVDTMGFPISYHVGILAFSGLTAYAGFFELCKPKKGEKVFVSAASGSVGNLVGQYAKLFGCYVVGCAGSPQKVNLLKEKLGFDEAFNYKEETDLQSALERYFPDGIDIYFDNVGAEMLEAAVNNMNAFGRIAACGVMAEYTDNERRAALNMVDVVYKRIKIEGFLVGDQLNVYNDFLSTTVAYLQTGKMHVLEDISHGVESIPSAFVGLFRGDNVGKKMVKLSND